MTKPGEALPPRVIVDQHGHYWRDYGDSLSMCPVSDENNQTEVVAVYVRDAAEWVEPRAHLEAAYEDLQERYLAAAPVAGGLDVERLAAIEHVIGMLDTDRDRELVRIALTRPRLILPSHVLSALAAPVAGEGYDENPCCYSLHEFEQVCPRTGTTFAASQPVAEEGEPRTDDQEMDDLDAVAPGNFV